MQCMAKVSEMYVRHRGTAHNIHLYSADGRTLDSEDKFIR